MGQIKLFNHLLYLKPFNCVQLALLVSDSNTWNHLIVCKQMSSGSIVVFRGQNENTQTREVGWNKYVTEQIYRIQVLYNS